MKLAERKRGTPSFPVGFDIQLRPHKIRDPIKWKEPARIFVNSMSDLFHKDIPEDYLRQIWDTMLEADHHIFQCLTKRSGRMMRSIAALRLACKPHIWLGTSVENQDYEWRIDQLLSIPRVDNDVRWISAEPLLGPLDIKKFLPDLTWLVAGGESGTGYRPMDLNWARSLRDQCLEANVPFYYKQNSNFRPGQDRVLDGRTWDEYPDYRPSPRPVVDHQPELF